MFIREYGQSVPLLPKNFLVIHSHMCNQHISNEVNKHWKEVELCTHPGNRHVVWHAWDTQFFCDIRFDGQLSLHQR